VIAAVMVCGMTSLPQQAFWKNAMFSPSRSRSTDGDAVAAAIDFSHVQF
jgi:hypothetical protein